MDECTRDERDSEVDETKAVLRHLAGVDAGAVIDRAVAAVDDLDAAVAFVEDVGVDELAWAVEAAEDPERRAQGERALAAFRRFRAAAAGDRAAGHFHSGHDTDLRSGDETPTE